MALTNKENESYVHFGNWLLKISKKKSFKS